jgi:hypothetical protein
MIYKESPKAMKSLLLKDQNERSTNDYESQPTALKDAVVR